MIAVISGLRNAATSAECPLPTALKSPASFSLEGRPPAPLCFLPSPTALRGLWPAEAAGPPPGSATAQSSPGEVLEGAPKVRTGARAAGGSTEKHKEEPEEGTHSPPAGHCRPPDGCPPEHLCLGQTSVRALTRTHGTFNCHPDPSRRSFWPRLTDGQSEAQRRRIPGSS